MAKLSSDRVLENFEVALDNLEAMELRVKSIQWAYLTTPTPR